MKDLDRLIRQMSPQLHADEFVFCSVPPGHSALVECRPICRFEEEEGVTLIVKRADAMLLDLSCSFPCRLITLGVHSDLEAIGFLAEIAARLAEKGIPMNCVSAYHHDHLFVPVHETARALDLLQQLQQGGC